jgi:DNA anti-recombination protein RmuC
MNRLTIAILLGTSLAAFGCSKEEQASSTRVSAEDVRKDTRQAVGTTTQFIEQEKDDFVRAAQHELDQLKDQLARLKSQAQSATGEARDKLDAQTAQLEPQLQAAEEKLAELKAASAEKWREAKEVLARQLDRLKQSLDQEPQERKAG